MIHIQETHLKNNLSTHPHKQYKLRSVILVGDVNAWNTLLGSEKTNESGRALEDVILSSNLINRNNGLPTNFQPMKLSRISKYCY